MMRSCVRTSVVSIAVIGALVHSVGCGHGESGSSVGHHDGARPEAELARGPHRGRLLSCDAFSVELSMFENGGEPRLRLYAYRNDEILPPQDLDAAVTLTRLGEVRDVISFSRIGDFLESQQDIYEPHSYDVHVRASVGGEACEWNYASYEARTIIPDEVARRTGIVSERATEQEIKGIVRARGKILPSEHRIAHVIPRFAGVVREGRKHVGDPVEKGEVVATIESNQSLQPFEVKSQISGTVINGHLIVGEFVPDSQWIYIVADLSVVWADLFVPLREADKLALGQEVVVASVNSSARTQGRVTYLAPYVDEKSQSRLVRVELPNPHNEFLPGAHVIGDIVVEEAKVPVAVRRDAIQRYNQWLVVFAKVGDTYEARPIQTGREDSAWAEVVAGLRPNSEYVSENAFLVKADILKSGATHDH